MVMKSNMDRAAGPGEMLVPEVPDKRSAFILAAWRARCGPSATVTRVDGYYLGARYRAVDALRFEAGGREVFVEVRSVGGLQPGAIVDRALACMREAYTWRPSPVGGFLTGCFVDPKEKPLGGLAERAAGSKSGGAALPSGAAFEVVGRGGRRR